MARTCSHPTCSYPVFGTDKNTHLGYCGNHQYLRTDNKKPKRAISKHSDRKPVHPIHFGFDDQLSMFEWLWQQAKDKEGKVTCKYTGNDLTDLENGTVERWVCCFAHILNKKNYPYFKLNHANVEITDPEFHKIIDQGTYSDRAKHSEWKWELWDAKVIAMKEEYLKFKKENLLG